MEQATSLFLCGDVMTGRGIDQILPNPVNFRLYESYVHDAREYIRLAEARNSPIPRPVEFGYIWGDALLELERANVDARIVNLETTITRAEEPWPKRINYRMSPAHIDCLTVAGIDCCCLANNHILDWGQLGMAETIETLDKAGIAHSGAGRSLTQASAPAVLDLDSQRRVLVFALGSVTSGIQHEWAATERHPGINLVENLSETEAASIAAEICKFKQAGDLAIVSIHWGDNWGYEIPAMQIQFAHRLIDGGVDLVHGHSSHHPKGIEIYRGHLILYGCGDFITDYEGIGGYEEFRPDLALMYFAKFDPYQGRLVELRMIPMQSRRLQLKRATLPDALSACRLLTLLGAPFSTTVQLREDYSMGLEWQVAKKLEIS